MSASSSSNPSSPVRSEPRAIVSFGADGRYTLAREIASGGMASVHLALQRGGAGFNRVVAVKRLRPELADDTEFFSMMMDEARLGSRVQHPNVVAILDVVEVGHELFLVFEYVHGESVARLLKWARERGQPIPPRVSAAILVGALRGLYHAHTAVNADGAPLGLVHRDISPQNVLVDVNGTPKVADFGIAKAEGRMQNTEFGQLKGKISYMAPEQLYGKATPSSDVFAMGVVAWEMFASRRLFTGKTRSETAQAVLELRIPTLRSTGADVPEGVERIVAAALERDPTLRPATALDMATAIESAIELASPSEVGAWVREAGGDALRTREREVRDLENTPSTRTGVGELPARSEPQSRTRSGWVWVALVALVGALALGLFLRRGTVHDQGVEPIVSEASANAPAPPSVPEPVPSLPSVSPAGSAEPKPAPDAGTQRAPVARPAPPRKAACNPPTYIDGSGVKRYKPECF